MATSYRWRVLVSTGRWLIPSSRRIISASWWLIPTSRGVISIGWRLVSTSTMMRAVVRGSIGWCVMRDMLGDDDSSLLHSRSGLTLLVEVVEGPARVTTHDWLVRTLFQLSFRFGLTSDNLIEEIALLGQARARLGEPRTAANLNDSSTGNGLYRGRGSFCAGGD